MTQVKEKYNGWSLFLDNDIFREIINYYFINKYVFLALCLVLLFNLILCFLPEKFIEKLNLIKNKEKENLLIYSVFALVLIFILSTFTTAMIQPVFNANSLSSIYSIMFLIAIINISTCFKINNFNKLLYILKGAYTFILIATFMTITTQIPKERLSLDDLMTYIEKDCVQYEKTHEIHVLIPTKEALVKPYQNLFKDKKIIWHEYDTNKPLKKVTRNTVVKNNNNAVVYFSSIGVDYGAITTHGLNPNFKINYSNYSDSTKIIYNKE